MDIKKDFPRAELYGQIRQLSKRLESEIMATPSGLSRNLLTDCQIVFDHIVNGKLLASVEQFEITEKVK